MIDFPASPTAGQIFIAPNGVTYQWSTTYTAWLPVGVSGAGQGGDFSAYTPTAVTISAAVPFVFNTIRSGNSGGYYNTSNGRYTPPAGRYFLVTTIAVTPVGAQAALVVELRKNGVAIQSGIDNPYVGGAWASVTVQATADANGTDYFEIVASCGASGGNTGTGGGTATFTAFPIPTPSVPAIAPSPLTPGDFFAYGAGPYTISSTPSLATTIPVVSGNVGGWYVPATGKYTPPAGRYFIWATFSGVYASGAAHMQVQLRKNATVITQGFVTSPGTAWYGQPSASMVIDANGTDVFDMFVSNSGSGQAYYVHFGAFPLNGLQPAGTITGWRQLGRIVPTAGQATIDFTGIPPDINDLMFHVGGVTPQTNDAQLALRMFDGTGTIDAGNNYSSQNATISSGAAMGANVAQSALAGGSWILFGYNAVNNGVANVAGYGIDVEGHVMNIRNTANRRRVTFNAYYLIATQASHYDCVGGGTWSNVTSIAGGLRFLFSTGNFAAGGAITLWGSP